MNFSLMSRASAFTPVGMSLAALTIVVVKFLRFGIVHEADEGADAHIFQLLMAAQVPFVLFFAIKWLRQTPQRALPILALQVGVAVAAFAAVYFLT